MPKYRLNLEFYRENQTSGWSLHLRNPDLEPAVEWTQFRALGSTGLPITGTARFLPVLHEGDPRMEGFRIEVPTDSAPAGEEFSFDYFAPDARKYRAALVEAGKLREDEECHWAVSVWACNDEAGTDGEMPVSQPTAPVVPGSLDEFLSRSKKFGDADESEFKVFIPRSVLVETAESALGASPMECGGILVGNLHRDTSSGELFQGITAYIPALSAVGSEIDLRFTPDAWRAVRAAVNLRGRGETWLGWAHSHTPVSWLDKCGRCPARRQRLCPLATRLFSEEDRLLHRAVFPRSFSIGLVANVLADGVLHSCFGWQNGKIEARSFYELETSE